MATNIGQTTHSFGSKCWILFSLAVWLLLDNYEMSVQQSCATSQQAALLQPTVEPLLLTALGDSVFSCKAAGGSERIIPFSEKRSAALQPVLEIKVCEGLADT